jgi:hypothetical protein
MGNEEACGNNMGISLMGQENGNSHNHKNWCSKNPLSFFALPKGHALECSAYVKNNIACIFQR